MMLRLLLIIALFLGVANARLFQSVPEDKATLIQEGDKKYSCPNCGMHLVKYYKTNHIHEGNQFCSMHCLYENTKGVIPEDVKVVDTNGLGHIDARSAYYVVGSKVRGTMTRTSNYAFATKADADEFAVKNGGNVMNFESAYKIAAGDFPSNKFSTRPDEKRVEKLIAPKGAKCPVCGMIVSKYPQWTTSLVEGKKTHYFDGVKDMMKYVFAKNRNITQIHVSDYYKLEKIDAKSAFYVVESGIYGPMGAELIPFKSEDDAKEFLKDHTGARIVRFEHITPELVNSL